MAKRLSWPGFEPGTFWAKVSNLFSKLKISLIKCTLSKSTLRKIWFWPLQQKSQIFCYEKGFEKNCFTTNCCPYIELKVYKKWVFEKSLWFPNITVFALSHLCIVVILYVHSFTLQYKHFSIIFWFAKLSIIINSRSYTENLKSLVLF